MPASPHRIACRTTRPAAFLFAFAILCSAHLLTAFPVVADAQTAPLERTLPVTSKTRLLLRNVSTISFTTWDKNEVAITAEAANARVEDSDINILTKENNLEINCLPTPRNKIITLRLRVPEKSFLEWRAYGYRVEIKEAMGEMGIIASAKALHLIAPARAEIDVRDAKDVLRAVRLGSGVGVVGRVNMKDFGNGPPYIKAHADGADVVVSNGQFKSPVGESTFAARAIATDKGSMGSALRDLSGAPLANTGAGRAGGPGAVRSPDAEEPILKLETHLVNLHVSVVDKYGKAIANLTQQDFRIAEDDDPQQITFFSPEKAPFNLVLLMDMSGSVREKLDLIQDAALHFLDVIGPEDRVAVLTFTNDVQIVSHLTSDRDTLRKKISELKPPVGATSFYDALGYVLTAELADVKGKRNAVIVITDGEDNALLSAPALPERFRNLVEVGFRWPIARRGSYLTFAQLLEGVLEADAIVYPIQLLNALNPPYRGASFPPNTEAIRIKESARKQLQELADASGGKLFSAERIEDLKDVYEQVAAEIRTVYSLAYTPKQVKRDGKFRRVRVQLNRADAAIRTRRGYYAR